MCVNGGRCLVLQSLYGEGREGGGHGVFYSQVVFMVFQWFTTLFSHNSQQAIQLSADTTNVVSIWATFLNVAT